MGGWMEALADKVHKQVEHIPQHCYISHNHPYISIAVDIDIVPSSVSLLLTYVGIDCLAKTKVLPCIYGFDFVCEPYTSLNFTAKTTMC